MNIPFYKTLIQIDANSQAALYPQPHLTVVYHRQSPI